MKAVAEPSATALRGGPSRRVAKRLLLATRPKFFTASVLPVLLGTGWGVRVSGELDVTVFVLALTATALVHAGANVLNDVYDDLSGSDRINTARIYPYTGGSRFIQNGVMTVAEMTRWSIVLLVAAVAVGGVLSVMRGTGVVLFGLAGAGLGLAYSMPPVKLSARGLGEIAVAIAFGTLPLVGAAWLQSGLVDGTAIILSIPISLWVAAILLINEVPDIGADAAVEKRTLAVRLGQRGSQFLYLGLHAGALLGVVLLVAADSLYWPVILLPGFLFLAALKGAPAIGGDSTQAVALKNSIELTLGIHALGNLWLIVWVWYAAWR